MATDNEPMTTVEIPAGLVTHAQRLGIDIAIVCQAALINAIEERHVAPTATGDSVTDAAAKGEYLRSLLSKDVKWALTMHSAMGMADSWQKREDTMNDLNQQVRSSFQAAFGRDYINKQTLAAVLSSVLKNGSRASYMRDSVITVERTMESALKGPHRAALIAAVKDMLT